MDYNSFSEAQKLQYDEWVEDNNIGEFASDIIKEFEQLTNSYVDVQFDPPYVDFASAFEEVDFDDEQLVEELEDRIFNATISLSPEVTRSLSPIIANGLTQESLNEAAQLLAEVIMSEYNKQFSSIHTASVVSDDFEQYVNIEWGAFIQSIENLLDIEIAMMFDVPYVEWVDVVCLNHNYAEIYSNVISTEHDPITEEVVYPIIDSGHVDQGILEECAEILANIIVEEYDEPATVEKTASCVKIASRTFTKEEQLEIENESNNKLARNHRKLFQNEADGIFI